VVFTMIFGTLDQALAASRHLYRLHMRIQGELPEDIAAFKRGSHYRANEVEALRWVYATLIESAVIAYEAVLPPLSSADKDAYYRESKTLAALFGIPASALPADWAGLEAYCRETLASEVLGVNALAREMAEGVLHGRGSWIPIPRWYRGLTALWMPERLRNAFALPFADRERSSAARALRRLPRAYRALPAKLRYAGPYQEAYCRIHGLRTGPVIRISNRFWMGQSMMPFAAGETEDEAVVREK
jgi:uncharacterized protein (DUF2236 family)